MAIPPSAYHFSPLTGGRQIRVLHLAPGNPGEPLTGRLVHVRLGAEPYEALSYEWGSPDKNRLFHFGAGRTLNITESLYNALQDLRHERGHWPRWLRRMRSRVIWADGICINQGDIAERKRQVAMMGDIYSTASRVVTYIGPRAGDSAAAIAFARQLRSQVGRRNDFAGKWAETEHQGLVPSDPIWAALRSLLQRGWSSRCWCALEFLLNRNLIMVCGGIELADWDLFPMIVHMVFNRILPVSLLPMPAEDPRSLAECLSHLFMLRYAFSAGSSPKPTLPELLRHFHPFQVSDPRDKVYALLGLASDADKLGIPIDYHTPTEELYINTARRIINISPDIRILYHNFPCKSLSLPSWVPDWTTWTYGNVGATFDGTYCPGGTLAADLRVHPSENTLEARGCLVDRISRVSGSRIGPHYHTFEPVRNPDRDAWLKEQEVFASALAPYPDGSVLSDVLWRTLIGDLTFSQRRAPASYQALFEAHIGYDGGTQDHREDLAREFVDAVRRRSRSRVLASTERRYLGAVPLETRPGDLLCMFHGAGQLFVIRKADKEGCFTYVGSAYVHGLMYGEILRACWYEECIISLV